MKTKSLFLCSAGLSLLAIVFTIVSCCSKPSETHEYSEDVSALEYSRSMDDSKNGGTGEDPDDINGKQDNSKAGVVTAGEWNDLTHWDFWSKLIQEREFADKSDYWEFFTHNRIAVKVIDEGGNALAGVKVKLLSEGNSITTVWETVSDNQGLAECWLGLFQKTTTAATDHLLISLNDNVMEGHPKVCPWDSLLQSVPVNEFVLSNSNTPSQQADIAFIVDATGSMSDEIDFLKKDLVDIINKVEKVRPGMKMRTAALFYRDEGDDYLTRHQDFKDDVEKTANYVKEQSAGGGDDYPEAVHTALDRMLKELSWNGDARTRLAFLLLDAPAHHETAVIRSLQKSIKECAKQGIKIIPVAASGVDKDTEFMLRFFAIATGGTYVFLTDDSGVGESHLAASVGDYEVELLNNLLIRLIKYYTE